MTKITSPCEIEYFRVTNESIPEMPIRSRFYHLQPLEMGTPMSECLTSYICRLATAHSVSVGNLFEYALVPRLKKDYLKTSTDLGPASKLLGTYRNQIKNINGIGKIAGEWVNVLESMTLRNELSSLTFLKMSKVLSRWYVNHNFQAWCPLCLEEMKNANSQFYYPLLWSLADIKICHIHETPLLDTCPNCSKQFLPLLRKVSIGFCSRCGFWLGMSKEFKSKFSIQLSKKEIKWNLFVSQEIGKLIAVISNPGTTSFTNATFQTIKQCVKIATNGGISPFARLIEIPLITFYGWYKGTVKPHLIDILRICYCLNLTLLEFFTQPEIIRTKEIKVKEWLGVDNKSSRPSPRPFNPQLIKPKLEKYLSVYPPLSMTQISREIGYDKLMLVQAFPEINHKIKSNYNKHQKLICEARRNKLEEEIKSAVYKLEEKGEFVSARRIAKFLNKPNYAGRRDVAQIIFKTRKIGKPGKI
ncbi:MAG: TniQ family protein [Pyrinomonadaceae bacterium]